MRGEHCVHRHLHNALQPTRVGLINFVDGVEERVLDAVVTTGPLLLAAAEGVMAEIADRFAAAAQHLAIGHIPLSTQTHRKSQSHGSSLLIPALTHAPEPAPVPLTNCACACIEGSALSISFCRCCAISSEIAACEPGGATFRLCMHKPDLQKDTLASHLNSGLPVYRYPSTEHKFINVQLASVSKHRMTPSINNKQKQPLLLLFPF